MTAGVILGALGLYKQIVDFAGAGATVPLLGFGYALTALGREVGIDFSKGMEGIAASISEGEGAAFPKV